MNLKKKFTKPFSDIDKKWRTKNPDVLPSGLFTILK
jgi:hypothetical protein